MKNLHSAMSAMYVESKHLQHRRVDMSVTQIDLDNEALTEVMRIAGSTRRRRP